MHPDQGLNLQPGMCPDQESNSQPFALWDGTQPTEPHWSGLMYTFLTMWNILVFIAYLFRFFHILNTVIFLFLPASFPFHLLSFSSHLKNGPSYFAFLWLWILLIRFWKFLYFSFVFENYCAVKCLLALYTLFHCHSGHLFLRKPSERVAAARPRPSVSAPPIALRPR